MNQGAGLEGSGQQWAPRVHAALKASHPELAACAPEPMADKGLAHWHFRLPGTGLIARVPKQSQMGLPAAMNLAYQASCFTRASAGGHTPSLHAVMPPSAQLPRGALLVQEIIGRPARLPADLPALMDALASIHALPLPSAVDRAPLLDPPDPLQALLDELGVQAGYLDAANLAASSRKGIDAVLVQVQGAVLAADQRPKRLIAFDAHPGNFMIQHDGKAMLVDLEKARYGMAALDVAHATLVTSTTWDIDSSAVLSTSEVTGAYRHWQQALGAPTAGEPREWVLARATMWLWSVTWCAKWRALSGQPQQASADGEDWSGAISQQALLVHVRGRVDDYLSPLRVGFVLDELATLGRDLAA